MEAIRTLIVDDERLARRNLRIRLRDIPDFEIVGECATGREAIAAVAAQRPEVMFLDIRMPDMDGFAVLEQIEAESLPIVVFVTAFDRFALEAFRVHALDYLLKPFEDDRFAEMLQACRRRVAELRRADQESVPRNQRSEAGSAGLPPPGASARNPYLDRLVIKSQGRIFFMKITALDWVEAFGNYVSIHAGEKSWLLRRTMQEMEEALDPRIFCRISRSAIVNLDRVHELLPIARGEHLVSLTGGRELKLTRGYRDKLEQLLGGRL
jgi:two-component system, LytTR family, response regulator